MALRPLSLVLLLTGLSGALVACGDKEDPGATDGSDGSDGSDGADGTEDSGGQDEERTEITAEALLRVDPPTLPEGEGGVVTATVRAVATGAYGAEVPLDEATAETEFSVVFSDGSEAAAAAEATADGALSVRFEVPPGLAPDTGARSVAEVFADGQPLVEVAFGLHVPPTALLQSITGGAEGRILREAADARPGLEICHAAVVDSDDDGVLEVLTLGVDGHEVVATACLGFFDDERSEWVCEDETLEADDDLYCGQTDHFLTAGDGGGEVGMTGVLYTAGGDVLVTSGWSWSGGAWTGTGTTASTSMASFAIVLGLNTTKERAEQPVSALLGVQPAAGGRFTGVYLDGREPWSWSSLGGVSTSTIATGQAFAGIFTAHDLEGAAAGAADSWVWTVDTSTLLEGAGLSVQTLSWSATVGGFVRARAVLLDDPGFTPELATASGQDLDGDGSPELIVEAWGEGRWAAWLIPDATDKAATQPFRSLRGRELSVAAPVDLGPDGSVPVARGTFLLEGDLDAGTAALASDNPVFVAHSGAHNNVLYEGKVVTTTWDVAEAMAEDLTEVAPRSSGVVGAASAGPVASTGRGVCLRGRCFASPGFGGSARLQGGAGPYNLWGLEADSLVHYRQDPDGSLLLTGGDGTAAWPVTAVPGSAARVTHGPDAAGVPTVFVDGEARLAVSYAARVSVVPDAEGAELAVLAAVPRSARGEDGGEGGAIAIDLVVTFAEGAGRQAPLPSGTTTGGNTAPVLLSEEISPEGGVLLGWRDGVGQAWLGVLDIAGAAALTEDATELPFLQAPVAVGEPLSDPDGALGLSDSTPGMVSPSLSIIADTPFLSMEDLEERFSAWDEPLVEPFDDGADAPYGPVLMIVGWDDELVRTISVDIRSALDGMVVTPVTEPEAPSTSTRVPTLSASLLPDAPPVVVSTAVNGTTALHLLDAGGVVASHWGSDAFSAGHDRRPRLSAGDVNGDGLADLIRGVGGRGEVVLSGGTGDLFAVEAMPAGTMTSFGLLLSGGSDGRECPVDPDGGSSWTTGVSLWGSGD